MRVSDGLLQKIVTFAGAAGARGASMGEIVEHLVGDGYLDQTVETAVWSLLEARGLTLSGFVQRTLRIRDDEGAWRRRRSYEFLLVPWSPEQDGHDESP